MTQAEGNYSMNRQPALFVFDFSRLMENSYVEMYKLSKAVVGSGS